MDTRTQQQELIDTHFLVPTLLGDYLNGYIAEDVNDIYEHQKKTSNTNNNNNSNNDNTNNTNGGNGSSRLSIPKVFIQPWVEDVDDAVNDVGGENNIDNQSETEQYHGELPYLDAMDLQDILTVAAAAISNTSNSSDSNGRSAPTAACTNVQRVQDREDFSDVSSFCSLSPRGSECRHSAFSCSSGGSKTPTRQPIFVMFEDWPEEVLQLNTIDLNKYIKDNKLDKQQKRDLKIVRRRYKNMHYARKARSVRRLQRSLKTPESSLPSRFTKSLSWHGATAHETSGSDDDDLDARVKMLELEAAIRTLQDAHAKLNAKINHPH